MYREEITWRVYRSNRLHTGMHIKTGMLAKPRQLAHKTEQNLPWWERREHYGRLELLRWHAWAWPGIAAVTDAGLVRRLCAPVDGGGLTVLVVGISSSLAIICILRCRARSRPLARRCRAAMQRMWSSKINRALNSGRGGGLEAADAPPGIDVGRRTFTCKHRLSSLSPLTSTSCYQHMSTSVLTWPFK